MPPFRRVKRRYAPSTRPCDPPQSCGCRDLVSLFLEDRVNRTLPASGIGLAKHIGRRLARGDDLAQRVEEQAFVAALAVAAVAAMQARRGNLERRLGEIE